MRFWWQREKQIKVTATPDANASEAPSETTAADRVLENASALGRFAWSSYQERGRGLLLFREEDLQNPDVDPADKLEYFTLRELNNLSDQVLNRLESHVGTYQPEREYTVLILGESLTIRVVEMGVPLSEL
jgi:hypothetical protein